MIAALWSFCRLGRPIFLLGGFVLYGLGAAWARQSTGAFDATTFVWGQATVTAAQLMTHYANDYFDLAVDRANATPTRWSGGSRILVEGKLSPRVALWAAVTFGGLALALGLVVARRAPAPAISVALLVSMVGLAWAYSAPPARLVARGAGELTTALVVTILTPLWGFHLQAPGGAPGLGLTLAVLALLQIGMLFAINFPDAAGDRASGKRTLVVWLGTRRSVAAYRSLLVVWAAALPALFVTLRHLAVPAWVALGPAVCVPLAAWQFVNVGAVARPSRAVYSGLAFRGVAMLFLASLATLVAVVVSPWPRDP